MSFHCYRSTLIVLNMVYVMVAFLLIGVATYGKTSNMVTSLGTVGGIVASGVFLLFVAVAGLFGAMKHHQVALFVYMVVLFAIFVIQFSVACACLAVSEQDQIGIARKAWDEATDDTKFLAEEYFLCCGFESSAGVKCETIPACAVNPATNVTGCPTCDQAIHSKIGSAFSASGGVGLFFSFTEIVGAYVALKYRNMVNPQTPSGMLDGGL